MDDTQKELQELTAAIHERIAALDAPVRDLILSNDYVINLKNIINAHSLNNQDAGKLEEITTNFLLGTINPKDLENVFIETFSLLNKDQIRSLYNDIKSKILNPVWQIVENAWAEDDEREKLFEEVAQLAEVPLPANMQEAGIQTLGEKFEKQITSTPLVKPVEIPTIDAVEKNWESKIASSSLPDSLKIESRSNKDRTLPKIGEKMSDPYRETPEE